MKELEKTLNKNEVLQDTNEKQRKAQKYKRH